MGSGKSNEWFIQTNRTTVGPHSVDEVRKLLERGEIKPESRVFTSRHPKEKMTAIELVKMRSDPAYGLFEILRKARNKRDRLRKNELEAARASELKITKNTPALGGLIPIWVWAVSGAMILSGAGLWTFARIRATRGPASAPTPDTARSRIPAAKTTPMTPSFGGALPRPTSNSTVAPFTYKRSVEASPTTEPAPSNRDQDRNRDDIIDGNAGDPREDPLLDPRDAEQQPLIENPQPFYDSEDPNR